MGVEKLLFRVFQPPKFVRKLLNVRSPQALKIVEITAFVPFATATPVYVNWHDTRCCDTFGTATIFEVPVSQCAYRSLMHRISPVALALFLAVFGQVPSSSAQEVTVRLIDIRNGHAFANRVVSVSFHIPQVAEP